MNQKHYLVTGGTGFIGHAIVRLLVRKGHKVRVIDNDLRGARSRLAELEDQIELIQADVRDSASVQEGCRGIDAAIHLAFLNGTRFFYEKPELVLDVGIRGIINLIDGCMAENVPEILLASSSEVYSDAPRIPTDESVPLVIPDLWNPRYSYSAGKIASEMLVINYGRKHFDRAVIFRPHNVYGPDMGWEHVIPQLVLRTKRLCDETTAKRIDLPIQGTGDETRAFIYIDDFAQGFDCILERGEHLDVYNIGTMVEVSIRNVAMEIARYFGRDVNILTGESPKGSPRRRCPDTRKLQTFGFTPKTSLTQGVRATAQWYTTNHVNEPRASRRENVLYEQR